MLEEYQEEPKLKKHKTTIILFAVFLVVLSLVFYTTFSGNVSIIGSTINKGKSVEIIDSSAISFVAELDTVPVISINGEFNKITLLGNSDSFLYVGDEKFSLANSNKNNIFLNDYEGEISFEQNTLSKLKGKASQISVNGVVVTPKSGDKVKVNLENFDYSVLEISNGVYIKKIDYITSGKIVLSSEKTIVNLQEENVLIKKFRGSLRISNNHLRIQGSLESLDTSGEQKISISV